MGSLQDALVGSGLARKERKQRRPKKKTGGKAVQRRDSARAGQQSGAAPGSEPAKPTTRRGGGSDLERAWAARRKAEKAEREREKQARVADQEARRKRNLALDRIVEGRILNVDDADLPRYFEHLGRIRRVLCTPEQREAINRGELGVVGLRGRYLIVAPDELERYRELAPDLVPDLAGGEPGADGEADDPPVPDDRAW